MGETRSDGLIKERAIAIKAALAVLAVGFTCIMALYFGAKTLFVDSRESELGAIARSAAATVDGDLHRAIRESGKWESANYHRAILPLSRIKAANPQIKYIYTMYAKEGKPHFVLDPTAPGDSDKDGVDDKSYPNDPYEDASPTLNDSLTKHVPLVEGEPSNDKWGTFVSAYAPFFDSKGRFEGVVGVDLTMDQDLARRRSFELKFELALFLSVAFSALTYTVALRGAQKFKKHQDALMLAQGQLEEANALLEQRVSERTVALQNAIQTKDTFLANMSHEMRTPLNGILGMTQLILDTSLAPEQREFVETVHHSGEHLLELVSDILCAAQIKHAGVTLDLRPTDINCEIERACESLKFAANQSEQELLFDLDPKLPSECLSDPLRLRQIVTNLVGNALKFNSGPGVVYISTSVMDSGSWVLQVMDTGIGISSDEIGLIFDEFTQVDATSTRRHGGTGLGLTITKGLVELMGGRIDVESELTVGTTFIVTLPLKPVAEEEAA